MGVLVLPTEEKQIRTGDLTMHLEFKKIFCTHYASVVRKVRSIVQDDHLAEDIAQEVFLKLYHTDLSHIQYIHAWLMKVAIHGAYNALRSDTRRKTREGAYEGDDHSSSEKQEISSEEAWMKREQMDTVQQVLQQLEERDRTILLMKYEGFSYREMAEALQLQESSMGTFLVRAKKRFMSEFEKIRGDER